MERFNTCKTLVILISGLLLISSCKKDEEIISEPTVDTSIDTSPRHIIRVFENQKLIREYFYSDLRPYKITNYHNGTSESDTIIFEYFNNKISQSKQNWAPNQNDWQINDFYYDVHGNLSRFEFNRGNYECHIIYDDNFDVSKLSIIDSYVRGSTHWTVINGNVKLTEANFGLSSIVNSLTFDNLQNPLFRFWIGETSPKRASKNNVLSEQIVTISANSNGGSYTSYIYDTAYFEYNYQYNSQNLPVEKVKTNLRTQESIVYEYEYIDL